MRELKSLIKAIVNVVLLIAETAVFTNISLSVLCVCVFLGEKRREKGGKKQVLERLSCFKKFCKSTNSSWTQLFVSSEKIRTLVLALSQASPFQKLL